MMEKCHQICCDEQSLDRNGDRGGLTWVNRDGGAGDEENDDDDDGGCRRLRRNCPRRCSRPR